MLKRPGKNVQPAEAFAKLAEHHCFLSYLVRQPSPGSCSVRLVDAHLDPADVQVAANSVHVEPAANLLPGQPDANQHQHEEVEQDADLAVLMSKYRHPIAPLKFHVVICSLAAGLVIHWC